jgi:lipoic acid synthetase
MKDLRAVSCDIMTIGQYLQPHARRLPVERYVTPEEFARWRELGMQMGFKHVESSPLTRSSYHARQQAFDESPTEARNEPQIYADANG